MAADDAIQSGGMEEYDKVPLLAFSPVGLKNGSVWHITGKTAVYPVFKAGPYKTWVSRPNLFIYSYFDKEKMKDEL